MSLKSCQTAYGPCKFYGKDEYIGRSLYAYGEWSGDECERLVSLASGLCIDVGANIGFMSMALGYAGFETKSFEPQDALFDLLQENVSSMDNVTVYNCAVGSTNGIAFMPKIRYSDKGNFGGVGLVKNVFGTVPVPIKTLDSYCFENVGLIKIDVEGHELEVLRGAVDTIARCSPVLYVEDDREDKRADLRLFIKSLGYKIEEHRPRLFRENNFAGNKTDIWSAPYESHNIICSK